jgi:hypothetical protein
MQRTTMQQCNGQWGTLRQGNGRQQNNGRDNFMKQRRKKERTIKKKKDNKTISEIPRSQLGMTTRQRTTTKQWTC